MRHVDNFFAEKSRVRTTTCTAFFEHYRGKDHGMWCRALQTSWVGALNPTAHLGLYIKHFHNIYKVRELHFQYILTLKNSIFNIYI